MTIFLEPEDTENQEYLKNGCLVKANSDPKQLTPDQAAKQDHPVVGQECRHPFRNGNPVRADLAKLHQKGNTVC